MVLTSCTGQFSLAGMTRTHAAVVVLADKSVGTHLIRNKNEFQLSIGLPVEGHVEIAREHSPFCSVIEFHNMALGMCPDFHGRHSN